MSKRRRQKLKALRQLRKPKLTKRTAGSDREAALNPTVRFCLQIGPSVCVAVVSKS